PYMPTLSLHDALPILLTALEQDWQSYQQVVKERQSASATDNDYATWTKINEQEINPLVKKLTGSVDALSAAESADASTDASSALDRKSTRLNSSHVSI